ncbi:MAG: hypothetical protein A3F73_10425 [Gallionellales bacterium RIFCSPLOWO2_12_FULL_59_22]|nr:MAG: hypothetical protein A3H99_07265 [Gallionellales bacterium RIFCSPLOWO2_02_FULL_59_110]OGT02599.1 MAG: hypothetical protein A2Z65_03660 [Gallionellales bacterium RIFCSPLOWO2_02_58_13]OGT13536.1 MAG: hypothetical protein A3F73_10425 [Gallionellales bacterium RIFCSPLOWO2_12_FULL_59_22]
MDTQARLLLEKLLSAGEKESAGRRSRQAALTASHLADYRSFTSLQKKESFDTTMRAAQVEGAVKLKWDNEHTEDGFIRRVDLLNAGKLAGFLGVVLVQDQVDQAEVQLAPFAVRFSVVQELMAHWRKLRKARGLGPDSVSDWLDAIRAIEVFRHEISGEVISMPVREASARLFNDSKRIERITGALDVLLANNIEAEVREPAAVWQELGLFREEHPVRLAGNVTIERERVTALLDRPYTGLPAGTVKRLASIPTMIMTIENLTTFHSEAKRSCDEPILLIYTAGMPSPAWRAMYVRLLHDLPNGVPVCHWGDIDEGGFRIAAVLAREALSVGYVLLPCTVMHPDNVPEERRKKATPHTLERIRHFAQMAGWDELGEAVATAGFTVEQEGLA